MTQYSESIGYTNQKPWGSYTILDQGEGFQVKRINVIPDARLSLQSHNFRTEYWVIISGIFEIEIDDKKDIYETGNMVFIPIGAKHRPKCISKEEGVFIEVQQGENLREDDIIRYEDDYGRK